MPVLPSLIKIIRLRFRESVSLFDPPANAFLLGICSNCFDNCRSACPSACPLACPSIRPSACQSTCSSAYINRSFLRSSDTFESLLHGLQLTVCPFNGTMQKQQLKIMITRSTFFRLTCPLDVRARVRVRVHTLRRSISMVSHVWTFVVAATAVGGIASEHCVDFICISDAENCNAPIFNLDCLPPWLRHCPQR